MIKPTYTLWSSDDAARVSQGDAHRAWTASGVSINTRTLQPGDLFIAIQGPNVDGHDYVADAFEKGAAAACVHHRPPVLDPDAPLLVVEDTMKAMEDMGRGARARLDHAKVIAVTGSVGKTGTKEALKAVLSKQGKTSASEGSLNNHWGLPLSLARTPADADYSVLEMGMNHPGELTPLSKMARPHVCVITTIAPAHTEFFTSTAEIADAKAEIFQGIEEGGSAVLNRDIAEFEQLNAAAKKAGIEDVMTFGAAEGADFRLKDFTLDANGSDVTAVTPWGELSYRIGLAGQHWVQNSLCILAAVHAGAGDVEQAAKDLADLTPPSGRGQRFDIQLDDGIFSLIDESYNASPVAMDAALAVLAAQPATGKRIAVLGDMLELGEDTPAEHAALADLISKHNIDQVYMSGEAMENLWKALPDGVRVKHTITSDLLSGVVREAVRPGDVVMVKGSAGSRMGRVVEALKALDKNFQKGDA
ncbi:UDP-N-acetylmuramoylalanyl-D-glutamyl-2,6-diaminopimelate--D-alanyl-D-alanine ligase [Magnetovibrio sp. PR-2]|uniref:UDP-N-acetylmuramoylalanyl-D-glutamyl-2, 6-diaminopimelate--D-alanyl-D-alanine ligase n=1 Tax=Magnetovibrio sp. PR-2 TaxID=3120356 RepID=UPI002FCE216F